LFGFTGQSLQMLIFARARLQMSARDHRRALIATAVPAALWLALAWAIGPVPFLFAYVLPLIVANVVVMSFIVTNHGLSPATDINDPLLGSLSVTVPRWLEWLTLDFGYHVEHHLVPAASARHGRAIRAELVATWPERYQSMPLGAALVRLFRTGRVYQDAATLVDPRTGGTWPALGPDPEPASPQGA
jgi:fatty acid desaturase